MAAEKSSHCTLQPSVSTWIWYPGDFEVWLGNIFNNRRTERGTMFPPFWKQDSHYPTVEFATTVELDEAEDITICAEGQYNLAVDGKLQRITQSAAASLPPCGRVSRDSCNIPKGSHRLSIKVWNQATPPALFIVGKTINTDASWLTTYEDKIWIDENGVAHGSGIYVPVGSWRFNSPDAPPSTYHLERKEMRPLSATTIASSLSATIIASSISSTIPSSISSTIPDASASGLLYDFGRETFGYLRIRNLQGTVRIYYGESREEALDRDHCETLDILSASPSPVCHDTISPSTVCSDTIAPTSKAFRFVYIEKEEGASYDDVLMDYEYTTHDPQHSGSFRCSDDELNNIWDVAAYTMDLTTREFFMDGIKRDRWTWSGDAIQSYLMNYYLHFDTECVKRTIRQLRGKDPVTAHVNTIMDYTFYWFKSVLDYYQYTGDTAFVREMWPRMVTLMDYVLSRTNGDGMAEGQPDDWIFVDWVDFPMHKRGTLCFEQILLWKALETMATCANLLAGCGSPTTAVPDYAALAASLRASIKATFWSKESSAYMHAIEDGVLNPQVTKFPNMFAILYGLCSDEERDAIMHSVMLNPDVDAITTPYMRFYELEALCMHGRQAQVLKEMKEYWGGMLREGATTFWEKYVPSESGTQHLAMYGRPYGKSLCHAWGASPIYIIGRYFLGVQPTEPGYKKFEVRPQLGDLEWMEGSVPTPNGMIHVRMDRHNICVSATEGEGMLFIDGREVPVKPHQPLRLLR